MHFNNNIKFTNNVRRYNSQTSPEVVQRSTRVTYGVMDHPVAQKWPPTVMTARLSDGLGSGRVPKMLGFPLGFFRGVGDISLIEGFEYHFSRQFGSDIPLRF